MRTVRVVENKYYERYNISEDASVFRGYFKDYSVDISLLQKLAKDLGFSYDLYHTLYLLDESMADTLVKSMSAKSKYSEIVFLLDSKEKRVISYSLDNERLPLLNSEFIKRVSSLVETNDAVTLSEVYYHEEDKLASVIIKKNAPIIIEEVYEGKENKTVEYEVGVLLVNDESSSTYSRLVLYVEGQPLYLPASYYNTTTTRYKRSTSSSAEALEVLALKVMEDLREDALQSKIYDLHYRYRVTKYVLASYEEYNTVLKTMRRIPTIIEDNSFLEELLAKYEDFEKKYAHLEDQRSSYIWRCTALSNISVGALVSITSQILTEVGAPSMEYFNIRELLGTYISTNRIAEEIAKEDNI